jgi:hypothetical protein
VENIAVAQYSDGEQHPMIEHRSRAPAAFAVVHALGTRDGSGAGRALAGPARTAQRNAPARVDQAPGLVDDARCGGTTRLRNAGFLGQVPVAASGPNIPRCQGLERSRSPLDRPKRCPGAEGAYAGAGRRGLGESLIGDEKSFDALLPALPDLITRRVRSGSLRSCGKKIPAPQRDTGASALGEYATAPT